MDAALVPVQNMAGWIGAHASPRWRDIYDAAGLVLGLGLCQFLFCDDKPVPVFDHDPPDAREACSLFVRFDGFLRDLQGSFGMLNMRFITWCHDIWFE